MISTLFLLKVPVICDETNHADEQDFSDNQ